jgi:ketosteroid isomerase-like protein
MKKMLFFCLLCLSLGGTAQTISKDSIIRKTVDSINSLLDHSVVAKSAAVLQKHYADDFVFTHGTGLVDSKQSWIKNVLDTSVHFLSRSHDSVNVELHGDIAILNGKLTVHRQGKSDVSKYALKYVRVYVLRKNVWQMISHRTTQEWHLE